VMGGAELKRVGALGNEGRVLVDAAEGADELLPGHAGGNERARRVRMMLGPVARDVDAAGAPGNTGGVDMINETPERCRAARPAHQATVQADGHQSRTTDAAFLDQRVEAVAQVGEELVAG